MTPPPRLVRALEIAGLGLVLAAIARYMAPRVAHAWDFETFYYAAAALRRGLDPYRLELLSAVAGKPVPLPFLYPPATLAVFVPLSALPLATATVAWLALKVALAVALVLVWSRGPLRGMPLARVALASLLAFNAALVMDVRAGNLATLEALGLWLAFALYVSGRPWAFALLVALVSAFKVLPIAFLALLLVPRRRKGPAVQPLVAGLAVFAAIVVLPALRGSSWLASLAAGAPAVRPHGEFNPSALGLFDTLLGAPRGAGSFADPALILWAIAALALLVASRGVLRRAWTRGEPTEWVVIACLLYGLLAPRMMAYSYVLLVAPGALMIERLFPRTRDRVIAWSVLVAQGIVRLGFQADFLLSVPSLPLRTSPVVANLPFLTLLGLWIALVRARDGGRLLIPAPSAPAGPGRRKGAR